jgi:hypothetical protein
MKKKMWKFSRFYDFTWTCQQKSGSVIVSIIVSWVGTAVSTFSSKVGCTSKLLLSIVILSFLQNVSFLKKKNSSYLQCAYSAKLWLQGPHKMYEYFSGRVTNGILVDGMSFHATSLGSRGKFAESYSENVLFGFWPRHILFGQTFLCFSRSLQTNAGMVGSTSIREDFLLPDRFIHYLPFILSLNTI